MNPRGDGAFWGPDQRQMFPAMYSHSSRCWEELKGLARLLPHTVLVPEACMAFCLAVE